MSEPFEYEVAEAVRVRWILRRQDHHPDGTEDGDTTAFWSGELSEVEAHFEQMIATADVAKVSGNGHERRIVFRDGSYAETDIVVDVTDWRCLGCRIDMLDVDEYYMVHDELWLSVVPDGEGHLCIGCLETRLGRKLVPDDFTKPSVFGKYTDRLRDRTGVPKPART